MGAGEARPVDRALGALASAGVVMLRGRCLPGSSARVDHVAVAASGVWLIDVHDAGPVERREVGGWPCLGERLYVGGHDRTTLVDEMWRRIRAVKDALGLERREVPVRGVLCFTRHARSFLTPAFNVLDVAVTHPKGLPKLVRRPGGLTREHVGEIERVLRGELVAA